MKRIVAVLCVGIAILGVSSCSTPREPIVDPVNSGPVGALNRAKDMLPPTITSTPFTEDPAHQFTYAAGDFDDADPASVPFTLTPVQCSSDASGNLVLDTKVHAIADVDVSSYKITYEITDPSANNQYAGTTDAYAFSVPADQDAPLRVQAKVSKLNVPLTCKATQYAIAAD